MYTLFELTEVKANIELFLPGFNYFKGEKKQMLRFQVIERFAFNSPPGPSSRGW